MNAAAEELAWCVEQRHTRVPNDYQGGDPGSEARGGGGAYGGGSVDEEDETVTRRRPATGSPSRPEPVPGFLKLKLFHLEL
jgi:hypothetical protein